jgi:hypothetical protein
MTQEVLDESLSLPQACMKIKVKKKYFSHQTIARFFALTEDPFVNGTV